ncbi:MAG: STAS domain protein [Firmicutes bacterium ADurb.Bin419]|mgnify:CR=1 FL=1|nr:MAG: STAS domain protein [Firmicutes bacterium ADurb.Bin419]
MDRKFIEQSGDITKVILQGKLDAVNAPLLMEELKSLIGQNINKIVFYVKDLEYISSAGLRTIIFAKQKIGKDTEVYMIGAQDIVSDVIKMSGLDNFLYLQESFED